MNPRLTPLAAALAMAFLPPAQADTAASLDPVVVTATRQATRSSELLSDVTVVDREALNVAGQSTLGEVLSRQPGIQSTANGSYGANTSLFVRGANSNQVLLLIDGMRVGSATTGVPPWSRVPLSQIERIEILRGPASSLYGSDAIGGVIQVFTKRGDGGFTPFLEIGGGTYGTYNANAGFSGSNDGVRYALNVAGGHTDGFNSISNPKNSSYNPDRDGYTQGSASGNLAWAFAKGHEIGVNAFYSNGENKYDSGFTRASAALDYRNDQTVSSYTAFLKDAFTDQWTSTLSIGASTDDSRNMTNGTHTGTFKTKQTQYLWQNDILTGFGSFLAALERLEQDIDGSTVKYAVSERTINSALLGWRGHYEAHRLQANVRRDDNSQFGGKTTGALSYGYQFTPNWRANAGYGTAFKAPSFNDLYYPLSFGSVGNPNLQPESSSNWEAALHYEAGLQHVSLTVYRNDVDNLISWGPAPGGGFTPTNVANARLKGATLAYDGRIGAFNLMANYDYLDPTDTDTGKQLARRAKNYGMAAIGQQLGAYEWRVEMQASDYRYDTIANTRKLPGYALVNLYGAYDLGSNWSLFARINNLFDRDYELAADYATPGINAFLGVRYNMK